MHTRPTNEIEGDFRDDWKLAEKDGKPWPCPHCRGGPVFYRLWESSCGGYLDLKYRCEGCRKVWWVEGADA